MEERWLDRLKVRAIGSSSWKRAYALVLPSINRTRWLLTTTHVRPACQQERRSASFLRWGMGEGEGKEKRDSNLIFETRSVLRETWMEGRCFPTKLWHEILFVSMEEKKKNGGRGGGGKKKGNVVESTWKMIYRDWNWRRRRGGRERV